MVTYTPNIPQPQDLPANSQSQILQNFQYLIPSASFNTTGLQRDHNMLLVSGAGDGTHNQVTYAKNQATPGFAGGVSVNYANTANGQSQLFFNNAAQNVQLTAAIASVPTIAATGVTFLPGGLLLQWGVVGINVLTNFAPAFNAAFTPVLTYGVFNGGVVPIIATLTNTQFKIVGAAGNATWMAIGQAP